MMNNDFPESGGYIQWAEWDVNTWEIIRTTSAPSPLNDELEKLREWTSTLGRTKPGPSFISSGFVVFPHCPSHLLIFPLRAKAYGTSVITILTVHYVIVG